MAVIAVPSVGCGVAAVDVAATMAADTAAAAACLVFVLEAFVDGAAVAVRH